jgi:hypothetical protein
MQYLKGLIPSQQRRSNQQPSWPCPQNQSCITAPVNKGYGFVTKNHLMEIHMQVFTGKKW